MLRWSSKASSSFASQSRLPYGIVAAFEDLYGNLWDLVQFTDGRD